MPCRLLIVALAFAGALAVPAAAAADDVVFGSPLTDPPDDIPYVNGWDQNVFNTVAPGTQVPGGIAALQDVGPIAAPNDGLVRQIKLRGFAPSGPLEVKFRVIRPTADGRFEAVSTPLIATLPQTDGVHVYDVPDPRAFRVQRGDVVGVFQQGYGGAGTPWQIFSRQPGWTTQKVAIHNGYLDADVSPAPVDREGNSTVAYTGTELLLQAVMSNDQCPGTDLPQLPCQSKLYLGGTSTGDAVKGRPITYTFTLRNGGPHPASGLVLRVNLPQAADVVEASLPQGCETTIGPPQAVVCQAGTLNSPQLGTAVEKISFQAKPEKLTKNFRATAEIVAPNVTDPQGTAKHEKVVSQGVTERRGKR